MLFENRLLLASNNWMEKRTLNTPRQTARKHAKSEKDEDLDALQSLVWQNCQQCYSQGLVIHLTKVQETAASPVRGVLLLSACSTTSGFSFHTCGHGNDDVTNPTVVHFHVKIVLPRCIPVSPTSPGVWLTGQIGPSQIQNQEFLFAYGNDLMCVQDIFPPPSSCYIYNITVS